MFFRGKKGKTAQDDIMKNILAFVLGLLAYDTDST